MKTKAFLFSFLLAAILLLTGQEARADHWTKTYTFQGTQNENTCTGFFTEESDPSTRYNSSPSRWTYETDGSISFTLADAVTLTVSSSTNKIDPKGALGLTVWKEAKFSFDGRYVYRVKLFDKDGNTLCDIWNQDLLLNFTLTFDENITFRKMEIFYGNSPWLEDIAAGSGTEADPFIITNTTMMKALAVSVNNYGHYFEGNFIKLGADITFSYKTDWDVSGGNDNNCTPIGSKDGPFKGTFDGDGHTISGIRIADNDLGYYGLFGNLGSSATVRNLIVRDATVMALERCGVIAGYNGGTISNCLVVNANYIVFQTTDAGLIASNRGTQTQTYYRDCKHTISGGVHIDSSDEHNIYAVIPGDGVVLPARTASYTFLDGTSLYDDGVTLGGKQYYTYDSQIALSYSGELPAGYQIKYTSTAGTFGADGFTMTVKGDATVTASLEPAASISVTAYSASFAGQTRYWATFYHAEKNYRLPVGTQAFYMKSDHALYRVGDGSLIPAGCAVVIMAESESVTLTATSDEAPSVSDNILKGTTTATEKTDVHVMGLSGDTFGFFSFTGTIPAGKAYYE